MEMIDEKDNGVITNYYKDLSTGRPIVKIKTEKQTVNSLKNVIQLMETPDEQERVTIADSTDMVEVDNYEDLTEENQYWVDYKNPLGNIYFHPGKKAQTYNIKYGSKGYTLISANKIFTKLDEDGNVVEVLSDILEQGRDIIDELLILGGGVQVFYKLQQAIADGNELHTNLQSDISTGTTLNESLKVEIPKAQTIEPKLKEQNVEANRILPLLTEQNEQAVINHNNLQEDIANTSEIIDKINAIGKDFITITPSMWSVSADEEGNYNYVWNHNLNTKNIILQCYIVNTDGSEESALTPYSIVDNNNIKVLNDNNTQTLKMSKI